MVGVYKSTDRKGATMTEDHRRPDVEPAQEVLLDEPGFLREIVESCPLAPFTCNYLNSL